MRKTRKYVMVLCAVFTCAVLVSAAGAAAGDFNLGVRGAVGFGTGSTDDDNTDGKIGFSTGGGLNLQYIFTEKEKWNFGLASGVEYLFLRYESTKDLEYLAPTLSLQSTTTYKYLSIPLTFKINYALNERLAITGDVGGFLGVFLSGETDNDYTPDGIPGLSDGVEKLDDSNTESINAGMRFAAGLEIALGEKLKLVPGFLYDLGLYDITKDTPPINPSRDTLSSWTFTLDLLYELF